MEVYNLSNIEAQFKNFLIAGNVSQVTIRNYLSDLRYFLGWFRASYGSGDLIAELNAKQTILEDFKSFMLGSEIPIKTANRRLSTIRKFFQGLRSEGLITLVSDRIVSNLDVQLQDTKSDDDLTFVLDDFRYDLLMNDQTATIENDLKTVSELLSLTRPK